MPLFIVPVFKPLFDAVNRNMGGISKGGCFLFNGRWLILRVFRLSGSFGVRFFDRIGAKGPSKVVDTWAK